jgi:hypothetical protein
MTDRERFLLRGLADPSSYSHDPPSWDYRAAIGAILDENTRLRDALYSVQQIATAYSNFDLPGGPFPKIEWLAREALETKSP